jgi:hypothetical protein
MRLLRPGGPVLWIVPSGKAMASSRFEAQRQVSLVVDLGVIVGAHGEQVRESVRMTGGSERHVSFAALAVLRARVGSSGRMDR